MPRIIEEVSEDEFDDDTDLPLPSRPLPDNNGKGPLLMEINEADDYIPVQNSQTSAPTRGASSSSSTPSAPPPSQADMDEMLRRMAAQHMAGSSTPNIATDITPYKSWTCVYPIYLDAKVPYGTGTRRVKRASAVWHPLAKDVADAAQRLGLPTLLEIDKRHPRDWANPGRVRVQLKRDGVLVNRGITNKKHLLEALGEQMQRTKSENVPREPYIYPPAPVHPTPARKHKAIAAKGKSAAHKPGHAVDKGAHEVKRTYRPLPVPPEPQPSLSARFPVNSPLIPSGALLDAVKAGITAQQEQAQQAQAAGAGKQKRKVVRMRG
ncbi:signal recognition particle, SRP19 subunit [Peniophora sp. CONT]|nr:signal recognition particle, SRP19 subunit [Peniophora sp. CONT]